MFFSVYFKYFFVDFLFAISQVLSKIFIKLFCFLIPIQKDKIIFSSFNGTWFGCNPKYILREIISQNLPYKIVWIGEDKNKEFKNIKFVNPKNKLAVIKELASSKIWIENSLKTKELKWGLIKKKNQFYINTWHGSFGIKKLFYDVKDYNPDKNFKKLLKKDFELCDLMFSNCTWEEQVFQNAMRYKGKILKIGHPRNDIFFENNVEYKNKICERFNIWKNKKIILYMPTYRNSLADFYYDIDFERLKEVLKEKFDGEWVVLVRSHNFNIEKKTFNNENIVDVSNYDDSQELLFASDVLISDYSSCMFDYLLSKKPCFVYAKDIDDYKIERGLYYSFDKTPFLSAKNNNELFENILKFDNNEYRVKCIKFLDEFNHVEDGNSSKRAVEIIKNIMVKNEI